MDKIKKPKQFNLKEPEEGIDLITIDEYIEWFKDLIRGGEFKSELIEIDDVMTIEDTRTFTRGLILDFDEN